MHSGFVLLKFRESKAFVVLAEVKEKEEGKINPTVAVMEYR